MALSSLANALGAEQIDNGWEFELGDTDDTDADTLTDELERQGFVVETDEHPEKFKLGKMIHYTAKTGKFEFPKSSGQMKMPKITFGSRKSPPRPRKRQYGVDNELRD